MVQPTPTTVNRATQKSGVFGFWAVARPGRGSGCSSCWRTRVSTIAGPQARLFARIANPGVDGRGSGASARLWEFTAPPSRCPAEQQQTPDHQMGSPWLPSYACGKPSHSKRGSTRPPADEHERDIFTGLWPKPTLISQTFPRSNTKGVRRRIRWLAQSPTGASGAISPFLVALLARTMLERICM